MPPGAAATQSLIPDPPPPAKYLKASVGAFGTPLVPRAVGIPAPAPPGPLALGVAFDPTTVAPPPPAACPSGLVPGLFPPLVPCAGLTGGLLPVPPVLGPPPPEPPPEPPFRPVPGPPPAPAPPPPADVMLEKVETAPSFPRTSLG